MEYALKNPINIFAYNVNGHEDLTYSHLLFINMIAIMEYIDAASSVWRVVFDEYMVDGNVNHTFPHGLDNSIVFNDFKEIVRVNSTVNYIYK
jgi:hypothetical protein